MRFELERDARFGLERIQVWFSLRLTMTSHTEGWEVVMVMCVVSCYFYMKYCTFGFPQKNLETGISVLR